MKNSANIWYYYYPHEKVRKGPISEEEIIELIRKDEGLKLWKHGMTKWEKYGETELKDKINKKIETPPVKSEVPQKSFPKAQEPPKSAPLKKEPENQSSGGGIFGNSFAAELLAAKNKKKTSPVRSKPRVLLPEKTIEDEPGFLGELARAQKKIAEKRNSISKEEKNIKELKINNNIKKEPIKDNHNNFKKQPSIDKVNQKSNNNNPIKKSIESPDKNWKEELKKLIEQNKLVEWQYKAIKKLLTLK